VQTHAPENLRSDLGARTPISMSKNWSKRSAGLGEMFEGDSADTLTRKVLLVSTGRRAEGLSWADLVARTPIGASGNYNFLLLTLKRHYYSADMQVGTFLLMLIGG
jgi:hypothetical protein